MLPRATTGGSHASSAASLRSNLSGTSVTSSLAGKVQQRKGAKTEWDVLEQLASMAAKMQTAQRGTGGATVASATGLPAKSKERMRLARDQSASKFSGNGILRPQTAALPPAAGKATANAPARAFGLGHSSSATLTVRGPPPGVSADGLAAARQMQLQLLSRERLHAHCDHFVQVLSGQSVCRNCRYALEALPLSRPRAQFAEEKNGGSGGGSGGFSLSASGWSQLDASRAHFATLFAPNQAAVRFFERRGLVDLEEVLPQQAQHQQHQQQPNGAERPHTAVGGREQGASAGSHPSSRPQTSAAPVRSHVVGARPLPSCSDVQSTASTLALQPHRRALAAAPDSLTLLRRLRRVLGFHPQRHQQSKPPPQYLAAGSRPQHDTPNPVLQSGGVALANIWPVQQS